jgi:hypothetical protein
MLRVKAPGILANDRYADPVSVTIVSTTAHGSLSLQQDGGFMYQPEAGFVGTDYFTYQIAKAGLQPSTAAVALHVQ